MEQKTFQDLYVGKFVHCKTEKTAIEFLKLAESNGFKWISGEPLTTISRWKVFRRRTCYGIMKDKTVGVSNLKGLWKDDIVVKYPPK